eukprot:CAMPEP_0119475800 /NCGR_PEP_ID=MMETSP1344-20130328/6553_1 /TAXON_ID=236787 /ORGANISM="Florenciella parvula, Strain CCMP2471" /LENGTH=193 /DNA_ID=CAMNT_0007509409 /DNA_START=1036 /DNA_END=1615 /DNA_ORIENTATION=-
MCTADISQQVLRSVGGALAVPFLCIEHKGTAAEAAGSAAAFVEGRMVVPVVPARMEKTAVLALGHLARAPRGTARIYFTVCARRGLARCPQPVAAVLVADLAALHSLARPTRARLRLSSSHLGSPVPSPYSAVLARRPTPPASSHLSPVSRAHRCVPHTRPSSRLGTNSTLRAKTTPGRARRGRTDPPPAPRG